MQTIHTSEPTAMRGVPGPRGYVHIAGEYAIAHRRDIDDVLSAESRRTSLTSPTSRVIARDPDGTGGLLVSTTTEHLAHRLGRALFKAFGGEVHHGFGRANRLALVWWRR